jgi:hypothetical protein
MDDKDVLRALNLASDSILKTLIAIQFTTLASLLMTLATREFWNQSTSRPSPCEQRT